VPASVVKPPQRSNHRFARENSVFKLPQNPNQRFTRENKHCQATAALKSSFRSRKQAFSNYHRVQIRVLLEKTSERSKENQWKSKEKQAKPMENK